MLTNRKISWAIDWALFALTAMLLAGCRGSVPPISPPGSEPTLPPSATGTAEPAATATPEPPAPTRPAGVNGAIESMTLITRTASSEYYAITYWSDGYRVNGFLGRPSAPGPHPAIIYNRGGYQEDGRLQGWEVALFTEAGYVAVASQYRGCAGSEGQEEFGGADVNDVLNLIPLLKQLPDVDAERMGMMGHSRGGMMTYLALKQDTLAGTRNIKAAAAVGGVADMFMLYQELPSYISFVMGKRPNESPALYEARSATYWPQLINAPLLVEHGEADNRVSAAQSRKLAQALEKAGKTVRLVTFPGEDHELTSHQGGMPEALAWFQHYLALGGEDHSYESHKSDIRKMMTWFQTFYPGR